jgi:hypothetical protein
MTDSFHGKDYCNGRPFAYYLLEDINHKLTTQVKVYTSISLTVASLLSIADSSWGDISRESPVESFPT